MWRSLRRRRPDPELDKVTSSPGLQHHGTPWGPAAATRPGAHYGALLGPLPPSPAPNCGRKCSISVQQCKRAHYHLLNMHEETVLGWPSRSPGSGLRESNKAKYSSAKRDEEGLPWGRQIHGGEGQVPERKRRDKVQPARTGGTRPRRGRRNRERMG